MGNECQDCGGAVEWKNAAGHYRDVCEDCVEAYSVSVADRARGEQSYQAWIDEVLSDRE